MEALRELPALTPFVRAQVMSFRQPVTGRVPAHEILEDATWVGSLERLHVALEARRLVARTKEPRLLRVTQPLMDRQQRVLLALSLLEACRSHIESLRHPQSQPTTQTQKRQPPYRPNALDARLHLLF